MPTRLKKADTLLFGPDHGSEATTRPQMPRPGPTPRAPQSLISGPAFLDGYDRPGAEQDAPAPAQAPHGGFGAASTGEGSYREGISQLVANLSRRNHAHRDAHQTERERGKERLNRVLDTLFNEKGRD